MSLFGQQSPTGRMSFAKRTEPGTSTCDRYQSRCFSPNCGFSQFADPVLLKEVCTEHWGKNSTNGSTVAAQETRWQKFEPPAPDPRRFCVPVGDVLRVDAA